MFDNICVRNIAIYRSLGIEIPEKTLGTQGNMEKLKNFKTINFKKKKHLRFRKIKKVNFEEIEKLRLLPSSHNLKQFLVTHYALICDLAKVWINFKLL